MANDFFLPKRPVGYIQPGQTNRFVRAFAPSDEELDAAKNGMRWNYALENKFIPPGSQFEKSVQNGAALENQWFANMLRQQKQQDLGIPTAAEIRAREMHRRAIIGEYDKAIADYKQGHWDDPDRAYEDFKAEIDRIKEKYNTAGFNADELRLPPPVAGNRNAVRAPKQVANRGIYNYAKGVYDKLYNWLESGQMFQPKFLEQSENTTYLDSAYETLLKYFKDSPNAMADAEKQRLQILVLPDVAHDNVVKTISNYRKELDRIMQSGSANDWSRNNRGKVNELRTALGFIPEEEDEATLVNAMTNLTGILTSALGNTEELPNDTRAALDAAKEKYDQYIKQMMFAANVAPHIVANTAANVMNLAASKYNDQAFVDSRGGAEYLKPVSDFSDQIPHDAMPVSGMLDKPLEFYAPSIPPKKAGGPNPSSNPQSTGEQHPANPGENVIHLKTTVTKSGKRGF